MLTPQAWKSGSAPIEGWRERQADHIPNSTRSKAIKAVAHKSARERPMTMARIEMPGFGGFLFIVPTPSRWPWPAPMAARS